MAVTRDGMPVRAWVLPGNTADNTTLKDFLARIEKRSPKAASLFAPDAVTGTRVMAFIEAVLKSGQANSAWTQASKRFGYLVNLGDNYLLSSRG